MFLNKRTGWFEMSPIELKAKLLRLNELYDIPMPKDVSLGQSTYCGARIEPEAILEPTLKPKIQITVKKRKDLNGLACERR